MVRVDRLFISVFLCAVILSIAGCASVMPLDGGLFDDHETVRAKGGVGNYLFRASTPRSAPSESGISLREVP